MGKNKYGVEDPGIDGDGIGPNTRQDPKNKSDDYMASYLSTAATNAAAQLGISEGQLKIMQQQQDIANEQFDLYKEIYLPAERKWVSMAQQGIPEQPFVERASADVNQSFSSSRQQAERELTRFGIDPGDPRYSAIMQDIDVARAAADAGARTNARFTINDVNYQRLSDVAKTGRGIPTEAASTLSSASNSLSSASSALNAGYGGLSSAYANLGQFYENRSNSAADRASADKAATYGLIGNALGTGAGLGTAALLAGA